MSKSFARPNGTQWSKAITPAYLRNDSFKLRSENMKPVDYNTGWRQYAMWRRRISFEYAPGGQDILDSDTKFRQKVLRNSAAREVQRGRIERFDPKTGTDVRNPFRPMEQWTEPIQHDEYQTQYKEKYEYPLMAQDPWMQRTKRNTRPTSVYYREPTERSWMQRGFEHPHDTRPTFGMLTYCILRADVEGLGAKGEVVAVDAEQFREDLHPNRAAVVATRESCDLLGVPYDPLYQDHDRREQHGKLMSRQPWVWDQLQGMQWESFTREPADNVAEERNQPWDGEVPRPIFAAEMIKMRKEEAQAKRAEKDAEEQKLKERQRGAASELFTL